MQEKPRAPLALVIPMLSVPILALDLATKRLADQHLAFTHVPLSANLSLVLAKNPFGAMSSFAFVPDAARPWMFVGVGIVAIALMSRMYEKMSGKLRIGHIGLSLVIGGALGNVFDRVRYGRVTDFIDVHASIHGAVRHWPIFNVADVAICVGIALMMVSMALARRSAAADPAR